MALTRSQLYYALKVNYGWGKKKFDERFDPSIEVFDDREYEKAIRDYHSSKTTCGCGRLPMDSNYNGMAYDDLYSEHEDS